MEPVKRLERPNIAERNVVAWKKSGKGGRIRAAEEKKCKETRRC